LPVGPSKYSQKAVSPTCRIVIGVAVTVEYKRWRIVLKHRNGVTRRTMQRLADRTARKG
jgi:hypothetical protein